MSKETIKIGDAIVLGDLLGESDKKELRERAKTVARTYQNTIRSAQRLSVEDMLMLTTACAAETTTIRNLLELDELFRRRS